MERDQDIRTEPRTMRYSEGDPGLERRSPERGWLKWLIAALVVIALVVIAFFAFGGDADVETDSGDVDVEAPDADVDLDAPDVDVDAPDVDVDGGDVDVEDGDAEASVPE